MRLVTYEHDDTTSIGLVDNGGVLDLNRALNRQPSRDWLHDVADLLRDDIALQRAETLNPARGADFEFNRLNVLPPVLRPTKVVGVGMNYRSFARQLGEPDPQHLSIFHKTSSALNGHGRPIERPSFVHQLVPEGELAVIVGRRMRQVDAATAAQSIGALCCANDISARDLEFRTTQWTAGKMLPTTCPLGPVAVTPDEADIDEGFAVTTYLNGLEIQHGHTSDMFFPVPELLAELSALVDLEIGDVVLTGTPSDLGALDPPVLLPHMGLIEVEVTGLGRLTNTVHHTPAP